MEIHLGTHAGVPGVAVHTGALMDPVIIIAAAIILAVEIYIRLL